MMDNGFNVNDHFAGKDPVVIKIYDHLLKHTRRFGPLSEDPKKTSIHLNNVTAFAIGVRFPIGVSFDFNNVPLDIFIQVVPVLDFFSGYAPHTVFIDFDASVGIRYWFN